MVTVAIIIPNEELSSLKGQELEAAFLTLLVTTLTF